MKCPHCGGAILSTQQRWQARMVARGCCARCGKRKPDGVRAWYCRPCQLLNAAAARRRHAKKRGAGLAGAI